MLACPNCNTRLTRVVTPKGVAYVCSQCGGRAVSFSVLKKDASRAFLSRIWLAAYSGGRRLGRRCPHCAGKMAIVRYPVGRDAINLDVCTRCQYVWFDPRKFEAVAPATEPDRRAAAEADRKTEAESAPSRKGLPARAPAAAEAAAEEAAESGESASPWQYLPAIFGLPVELDDMRTARKPALTWTLSVGMGVLLAYLTYTSRLEWAVNEWGLIPAQWDRHGGLTLLTSFFLHGGWLHLFSNLYFFVVFGDNVEDRLGAFGFLLLLAGAHLSGVMVHMALDPHSAMPMVGASAGISGVIACYAVAFPHTKLGFLFYFRFFRISAIWALVLYAALQMLGSWQQVSGFSDVSYLAHLGGLAIGVLAGLLLRVRS